MTHRDTCEAIEPLLAPYGEPDAAGLMSGVERERLAAHLEACAPCRRAAETCRAGHLAIRAAAAELATPAPPLLAARCRAAAARAAAPRRAARWAGWSAAGATAAVILFVLLMPTRAVATQMALDHMKCAKFSAGDAHDGSSSELEGIWRTDRQQQISIPAGDAAAGLRLVGLRRCVSSKGSMAHVMYERAGAPLSLFVLAGGGRLGGRGAASEVETIGHKAILWTSGAATYVLVGRGDLAATAASMRKELE
jgi:anti-sigma factor RsiW